MIQNLRNVDPSFWSSFLMQGALRWTCHSVHAATFFLPLYFSSLKSNMRSTQQNALHSAAVHSWGFLLLKKQKKMKMLRKEARGSPPSFRATCKKSLTFSRSLLQWANKTVKRAQVNTADVTKRSRSCAKWKSEACKSKEGRKEARGQEQHTEARQVEVQRRRGGCKGSKSFPRLQMESSCLSELCTTVVQW